MNYSPPTIVYQTPLIPALPLVHLHVLVTPKVLKGLNKVMETIGGKGLYSMHPSSYKYTMFWSPIRRRDWVRRNHRIAQSSGTIFYQPGYARLYSNSICPY